MFEQALEPQLALAAELRHRGREKFLAVRNGAAL
jgi:hypothetical protein